jgi:hypothetical protein
MRDPDRIWPIVHKLGQLWERNPDLRFFQLIRTLDGAKTDSFYTEDDETLELLTAKLADYERM